MENPSSAYESVSIVYLPGMEMTERDRGGHRLADDVGASPDRRALSARAAIPWPLEPVPSAEEVAYSLKRYLSIKSAYSPEFSPDGQRLAYLSDVTGVPQIWMTGLSGSRSPAADHPRGREGRVPQLRAEEREDSLRDRPRRQRAVPDPHAGRRGRLSRQAHRRAEA